MSGFLLLCRWLGFFLLCSWLGFSLLRSCWLGFFLLCSWLGFSLLRSCWLGFFLLRSWLSFFMLLLLRVCRSNRSKQQDQNSRANKTQCFHVYCLHRQFQAPAACRVGRGCCSDSKCGG